MALEMPAAAVPSVELEMVTRPEDLESLRAEWSALLLRCPAATPFQSPEWLLPWWRRFGSGRLLVLVLRREGRLAGIGPFYADPERRLLFLGTGISDHLDILIEPGMESLGAWLFLDRLARERASWDVGDLRDIPRTSPLLAAAFGPGLSPSGGDPASPTGNRSLRIRHLFAMPCPVFELPPTVRELVSGYTAEHRRHLRRSARMLEQAGEVRFETAGEEDLPEYLEAFYRLHADRWRQKGLSGVLAEESIRAFHREAARGLLQTGRLRFHGLRMEGRIIATVYAFAQGRTVYAYLGGFDPAWGRFSPGRTLLAHAIGEAVRDGFTLFDFLRGTERYKYKWGAKDRVQYSLLLERGGSGF